VKKRNFFFKAIQRGSEGDLELIEHYLKNDSKKYFR